MSSFQDTVRSYYPPEISLCLDSLRVGIAGAGGIGSNLAMMLVRSGVSNLTLVDFDKVEAKNLNRQHFFPEDVGKSKVKALSDLLKRLDPSLNLDCHDLRLTADNSRDIFKGCDIIAEAVDEASVKVMLFELFSPDPRLYVTASGLAGLGREDQPMRIRRVNPSTIIVGDFAHGTEKDPWVPAPRVIEAACLQATVILRHVTSSFADR